MNKSSADLIICFIVFTTIGTLYIINKLVLTLDFVHHPQDGYSWLLHGVINILGYSTVYLPGYLVYKYIKKINYLNRNGSGVFTTCLRKCFGEDETLPVNIVNNSVALERTPLQEAFLLMFYFFGLQMSFLTWGVLQEKVMTQKYRNTKGEEKYFKDSQFLVFVNRILAFLMSSAILVCRKHPFRNKCPLYKYVFCSFSNIMSSWCQYEALKYVSFPHQVLAKSAKTIPVMIMGKIVSKNKYEYYEYVTAIILSVGMLIFMLDTGNDRASSTITTFSGALLLISYIGFDSFTSNWQGALFKQYSMKPIHMMCFVNMYSCVFTAVSLLQQGGFLSSLDFMIAHPTFILDCVLLSLCSAGGQLFIFSTLSTFGPVVFAIITTIRQGFSVLLSCIIYRHQVHVFGALGLTLVFFSIFLRIYCGYRMKAIRLSQGNNLGKPQKS